MNLNLSINKYFKQLSTCNGKRAKRFTAETKISKIAKAGIITINPSRATCLEIREWSNNSSNSNRTIKQCKELKITCIMQINNNNNSSKWKWWIMMKTIMDWTDSSNSSSNRNQPWMIQLGARMLKLLLEYDLCNLLNRIEVTSHASKFLTIRTSKSKASIAFPYFPTIFQEVRQSTTDSTLFLVKTAHKKKYFTAATLMFTLSK